MDGERYVCRWCNDLFRNYDDFSNHESIHTNLDILNGIQHKCDICDGILNSPLELQEHKNLHQQLQEFLDGLGPSPSKLQCSDRDAINISEDANQSVSWQSNIHSNDNEQFGQGVDEIPSVSNVQENEQNALSYTFQKKGEKTFKNGVVDRHYQVKFNLDNESQGTELTTICDQLENMLDDVLHEAKNGLSGSDLGRLVFHHERLENNVIVPLRKLDDLTGRDALNHLENVMNSHADLDLQSSFFVDVGTMELPKAGKGLEITSLTGSNNSIQRKRSLIEVKNDDNLCLARAIALAFASANQIPTKEWKRLTNSDSLLSIEELVLKYKKCPTWYYRDIRKQEIRPKQLTKLTLALCSHVDVGTTRMLTLRDIVNFENFLNVDILVVSSAAANKFIRIPGENSTRKRLYLYLIQNENNSHFHAISNISRFHSGRFCHTCLKPYHAKHQCVTSCFVCKRKSDCKESECQMSCLKCHMTCRSLSCFEAHQTKQGKHLYSSCDQWWKCTVCKKVLQRNKRDPSDHVCQEFFCNSCQKYCDKSHLCYIRVVENKSSKPRYIFFDYECTISDEIFSCTDGYMQKRNPVCEVCQGSDKACGKCSLCVNCQKSWCGKFKHTPNMVICSKVCEFCIEADDNFICENCCSRCTKCDKFNQKENCYETTPCKNGTCGKKDIVFQGETTKTDFGGWLFSKKNKGFTALAHNMSGYDGYFILEYLIDNSIRPDIIYNGSKIMYLHVTRGLNIKVIDSLNFLPMRLSQFPKAFGLKTLKKGYFPHLFNKRINFDYSGPYPESKYYSPEFMSAEERLTFLEWHQNKIESDETFDFQKEIYDYCLSDVTLLKKACLSFREILISITDRISTSSNEDDITIDNSVNSGIDPFNQITIASVCMKVFKSKFLSENWEVKLKKDGKVLDWVPATLLDDNMTITLNQQLFNCKQIQEMGYIIEEKKFVNSPIAQVPSYGYTSRDTFSKCSIQWLEWYMKEQRNDGNPIHIQHALNGGEITLPGTRYRLDGFSEKTKTAFEFNGCVFHGCSSCYPSQRTQIKIERTKQTMNELRALTLKKEKYIREQGMNYICIWEHEFKQLLETNTDAAKFIESLNIQDRLDPRDSFFGGRTNAIKLYYKTVPGEKIHYLDFCSLYPWVNKYGKYPVREPQIITENFKDISQYFGIAKVEILPPRNLYHPVLPQKINGKLTFALCHSCAEKQNQTKCNCNDNARTFLGTYCIPELLKAIELGYELKKIYEVYHWDETEQYDPKRAEGGLFGGYINLFLKIKQESSGWPDWVRSEEDEIKYIEEYAKREGIILDRNKIVVNKALRSIAKLCLNSFWGKFGQRLNMPHTAFFHDSEVDKYYQCISDPSIELKDFHIISEDMLQLTWENRKDMVKENYQTNIFLATFTTCWARLKLYTILEMLGNRVLYFDTDSVIFTSREGDKDPETGTFLGDLTNELDIPNDYITEFVAGGPKNYAYKTFYGKQVCKVKGFSLNYSNSERLNFKSMAELVCSQNCEKSNEDFDSKSEHISIFNPTKITRHKYKRKLYNRVEKKDYKIVYDKRVIQTDGSFDTLPYGY